MDRKKYLKNQYKATVRPMGVYQILNLENEKRLVGSSLNLNGILNRHRFELDAGSHPIKELQEDWKELGIDRFEFEILEELPARDDPDFDDSEDLKFLENLWIEKLKPFDEGGYNKRVLTRDEMLWKIAAARNERNR